MQLSLLHYTGAHRVVEDRIRRYAKTVPWILVAWSGGKDSTAALLAAHSCCRERLYAAYVHIVGQTHHSNVSVVLRVAEKLGMDITWVEAIAADLSLRELPKPPALLYIISKGRHGKGFWHEALQRGWPVPAERTRHRGKRWCCQVFKTEPLDALARHGLKWHVVGVKRSDSHYRAKLLASLDPRLPVKRHGSHSSLYPLYDLSNEDIWSLLKSYDPEIYNTVRKQYEIFGYSPNCTICPLQSKQNFERTTTLMPTPWLEKTRQTLLVLYERQCRDNTAIWSCKDIQRKLEAIEKELERRATTQHKE